LATVKIEKELIESGEHPILRHLLVTLLSERDRRKKHAKVFLDQKLSELDLLVASGQSDVATRWLVSLAGFLLFILLMLNSRRKRGICEVIL